MIEEPSLLFTAVFVITGFGLALSTVVCLVVMSSNTKEGHIFPIGFFPVFKPERFNQKGDVARKIYNITFFAWLVWGASLLVVAK